MYMISKSFHFHSHSSQIFPAFSFHKCVKKKKYLHSFMFIKIQRTHLQGVEIVTVSLYLIVFVAANELINVTDF